MKLYHNSKQAKKIISQQKIKPTKFNYVKYIEQLLERITINEDTSDIGNINTPFMGEGIYCFDSFDCAEEYDSKGKVVTLHLDCIEYTFFDLTKPEKVFLVYEELDQRIPEKLDRLFKKDQETLKSYKVLIEFVKNMFMDCYINKNFNGQHHMGIVIFLLEEFSGLKVDIFANKHKNMVNSRLEKYFLIRNPKIVKKIT